MSEAHCQRFDLPFELDADGDGERHPLYAGVVPKVARAANRYRHNTQSVERGGGALLRRRIFANVIPSPHRLRPEGQRLDGTGLAAIVWANQYGWVIQLNALLIAEALEVLYLDVVQQTHGQAPLHSRLSIANRP